LTPTDLLLDGLAAVAGLAAAISLLRLLPLRPAVLSLRRTLRKSIATITSRRISDHWKERVLPSYAGSVFLESSRILVFLLILLVAFGAASFVVLWPFLGDPAKVLSRMLHWQLNLCALLLGCLYFAWDGRQNKTGSAYNFLERAFHAFALDSPFLRRVALDIDISLGKGKAAPSPRPVFVAGLARSGTTIVLEALYSTGAFSSLTYRNMPFVHAPLLWSRLSSGLRSGDIRKERAHGDGIEVGYDSPEAFEEVFWLTAGRQDFLRKAGSCPHAPDDETISEFRHYVRNVVAASDTSGESRYLSKNNNNVLRIGALKKAFPDAIVLVPFRNPVDHAQSLLRQHLNFLELHARDPFSLRYMTWLGHFEFGANMRPFLLGDSEPGGGDSPLTVDYWLHYWADVYGYILRHHRSDVVFFDHDLLCRDPAIGLRNLAQAVNLEPSRLEAFAQRIQSADKPSLKPPAEAQVVYKALQAADASRNANSGPSS